MIDKLNLLNRGPATLELVYDRGELMKQRKKALQRCADQLDRVTSGQSRVGDLRA